MNRSCRLCHGSDLIEIFDAGAIPVFHRLLLSRDAEEDTFRFQLSLCRGCGLVQVCEPVDPELLYRYYNYNFSSWKAEPHRPDEIDTILAHVRPRRVFEIGCNEGLFMHELRERSPLSGVGVEPNPVSGHMARERGFTVISEMISPSVCKRIVAEHGRFDLVVSRQVVEHVHDLDSYFECIKMVLAPDAMIFVDTPDSEPAFRVGDATVLREEHCSYFTESVFTQLLRRHGFEPLAIRKHNFSGGTLAMMARRLDGADTGEAHAGGANSTVDLAAGYGHRIAEYGSKAKATLLRMRSLGTPIVLYGVGARGMAALNMLHLEDVFDFAIDDEPNRQGRFTPGARLRICDPSVLAEGTAPILCMLAVNNENEERVKRRLREFVPRPVHFASLCAPSDIWRDLALIESL
jgi:SAM-dependent methyltransferase